MINVAVDLAKFTKLKTKMEKYGPYAIGQGLEAANDYLNSHEVKDSMYPPRSYEPFVWSSERQRRAYFASDGFGAGIPYTRTNSLNTQGEFKINDRSYWIEYVNNVPYAQWVIHPTYQIIGMKTRGWPIITAFTKKHSSSVVTEFKSAVLSSWERMDSFMYGGGVGL